MKGKLKGKFSLEIAYYLTALLVITSTFSIKEIPI